MNRLVDFIRQSRSWANADTGSDLFRQVAHLLHHHMDIQAGMFLYARRYLSDEFGNLDKRVRVYLPWGFTANKDQLEKNIEDSPWIQRDSTAVTFRSTERWYRVEFVPEPWKTHFVEAGIGMVGSWALREGDRIIGLMILGRPVTNIPDDEEEVLSLCAVHASLILELVIARRVAEETSRRDPLTGAYNRRGFTHVMEGLCKEGITDGRNMVMAMLDVNDFKQINDLYGHARGDEVLEDIAKTLQHKVCGCGVVARFGGDEFVFLWNADGASPEYVRQVIMDSFREKNYRVCLGCVEWRADMDWQSCLHQADVQLYEWKRLMKAKS